MKIMLSSPSTIPTLAAMKTTTLDQMMPSPSLMMTSMTTLSQERTSMKPSQEIIIPKMLDSPQLYLGLVRGMLVSQ